MLDKHFSSGGKKNKYKKKKIHVQQIHHSECAATCVTRGHQLHQSEGLDFSGKTPWTLD